NDDWFTKVHEIGNLQVIGFDVDEDTIYGETGVGDEVIVNVFADGVPFHEMPSRTVVSDENGEWEADFSVAAGDEPKDQAFDLQKGMSGSANLMDEEGNGTVFYWSIPNPHFEVYPQENRISGWEWPDGEYTVQVTVKRDGEGTIFSKDVSPEGSYFDIVTSPIQSGDIITVSAGEDVLVTHAVAALTMEVIRETGVITGTATPGIDVRLILQVPADGPFPPNEVEAHDITPDGITGDWGHDFEMSIENDQQVVAKQSDGGGGSTVVINVYSIP
ncbi:MAG: hypothetical protein WAO23_02990, partial [Dethiobacteria bacterium]